MKLKIILTVAVVIAFFACSNNDFLSGNEGDKKESGKASITINFNSSLYNSNIQRTIVADFSNMIWSATLTNFDNSSDVKTAAPSGGSVTFSDITPGKWIVKITAGNNSASGYKVLELVSGVNTPVSVPITFLQTPSGKGNLKLTLTYPSSTGIDSVTGTLNNQTINATITNSSTDKIAIFQQNSINSGSYEFILTFKRGGKIAGIFCEAVNIWDNAESSKWIDPTNGTLKDTMVFTADNFFETNANLSLISIKTPLSFTFDSNTTNYNIKINSTSFSMTTFQSIEGQRIQYQYGSDNTTDINSGETKNFTLNDGITDLSILVTAPDKQTTKEYKLRCIRVYAIRFNGGGATSGTMDTLYETCNTVINFTNQFVKLQDGITCRFVKWTSGGTDITSPYIISTDVTISANWSVIGGTGPAGGIVFYDAGSITNGWRYMEFVSSGWTDKTNVWSNVSNILVGNTSDNSGYGKINTLRITNQSGFTGGAALDCENFEKTNNSITYKDWFLPSLYELNAICVNNTSYSTGTSFKSGAYWTSCESDSSSIKISPIPSYSSNSTGSKNSATAYFIRPVRAFRSANPTYIVLYNSNGATGGIAPTDSKYYEPTDTDKVTISGDNGLTKTGCTFAGWNTKSDGSGTDYTPNQQYKLGSNLYLYAKWNGSVDVTFKANPTYQSLSLTPSATSVTQGTNITVTATDISGASYKWYVNNVLDGSQPSNTFTFATAGKLGDFIITCTTTKDNINYSGSVTAHVVAQTYNKYTLYYDINGAETGSAPPDQTEVTGTNVTIASGGSLTKSGFTFIGWNTQADGLGATYKNPAIYTIGTSNVALYAKWGYPAGQLPATLTDGQVISLTGSFTEAQLTDLKTLMANTTARYLTLDMSGVTNTTITDHLFQGNKSITKLIFPNNLTTIPCGIFANLTSGTNDVTIVIPASVITIESSAFATTSNRIKYIYFKGATPPTNAWDQWIFQGVKPTNVYVVSDTAKTAYINKFSTYYSTNFPASKFSVAVYP